MYLHHPVHLMSTQQEFILGDWMDIYGATSATYQPEALMATTAYQLVVNDTYECGPITTNTVTITVYDELLSGIAADQTICYNTVPAELTSNTTGGNGSYIYQWQESADGITWANISGATADTYQPGALMATMYYQLIVDDTYYCGPITTNSVMIMVYDELLSGIADDQTICYNTIPDELTSTTSGGNGSYVYQWQESSDGILWADIAGANASTYQPGALMYTMYYQLIVNDTYDCGPITTNSVMIFVYDEFLASIAADQTICYNTIPAELTSTVTGGEGTYTYQWQVNEGGLWVDISAANGPTYQPEALMISMEYRLFVTDLCGEIATEPVLITVYEEFMASIAADQTICYNTVPEELTSTVTGGEGTYTYQWQEFVDGAWVDIYGADMPTYQPVALMESMAYRLYVVDFCGEIYTEPVFITVYDEFLASIAADQTICYNTVPAELTSTVTGGEGTYTYQLLYQLNQVYM